MNASKTIPMCNFPKTAKLLAVNAGKRTFRLGSLTFKFPNLTEDLKDLFLFLENFLILEVVDSIESEYVEPCKVEYYIKTENQHNLLYKEFFGMKFYSEVNNLLILQVGIEATGDERFMEYVFNYYPNNLSINSVDSIQLFEAVNKV